MSPDALPLNAPPAWLEARRGSAIPPASSGTGSMAPGPSRHDAVEFGAWAASSNAPADSPAGSDSAGNVRTSSTGSGAESSVLGMPDAIGLSLKPVARAPRAASSIDWRKAAALAAHAFVVFVAQNMTRGVAVSAVIHSAICLVLMGLYISSGGNEGFSISSQFSSEDGSGLDDSGLDSPLADANAPVEIWSTFNGAGETELDSRLDQSNEVLRRALGGGEGDASGGSGDGGDSMVPALKVPKHAVSRGSFTAWTDPKDPEPKQNYRIIIQVKLPAKSKAFTLGDLSGKVVGTDKYEQLIPSKYTRLAKTTPGFAEVVVYVPGAERRVRDIVTIESRMLKERQVIRLEF